MAATRRPCSFPQARPVTAEPQTAVAAGLPLWMWPTRAPAPRSRRARALTAAARPSRASCSPTRLQRPS
eukprot:5321529-Pyramimonas_sp.AAC.1